MKKVIIATSGLLAIGILSACVATMVSPVSAQEHNKLEEAYREATQEKEYSSSEFELARKKKCMDYVAWANSGLALYHGHPDDNPFVDRDIDVFRNILKNWDCSGNKIVKAPNNAEAVEGADTGESLKTWKKITAGADQNQYVMLASQISGHNKDFILTLNAENGLWNPARVSPPNSNGTRDWGFCQLNSQYHWDFITSDEFKDAKKQLEYCWNIYKDKPYRFYGHDVRLKHDKDFKFQ